MKAVCIHQVGGAERLVYEEAPLPVAKIGEVLWPARLWVAMCAHHYVLNHLQTSSRQGSNLISGDTYATVQPQPNSIGRTKNPE